MRKWIIDTDTGSDDAVALMLAVLEGSVDILGVTTVCGNVPLPLATKNALATLELCGRNIPVYEGADCPLLRPLATAVRVHGDDGMGDRGLIHPTTTPAAGHASDYILETVRAHPGEIELITLGPVTNIALAILKDRQAMRQVKHLYIMGTAGFGRGNTTPVATFNVYVDADAFSILLHSGIPMTIVGFDQCIGPAALYKEELDTLSAGNPLCRFAAECNSTLLSYNLRRTGEYMVDLPDAVAVAVALWEDVVLESVSVYALCCTREEATYGQVIFYDRNDFLAVPQTIPADNAVVVKKLNHQLYKQRLMKILKDA